MSQANPIVPPPSDAREFWKPQRPLSFRIDKCEGCGNEMVVGGRFCHLCGAQRDVHPVAARSGFTDLFDWGAFRDSLGLSTASLVLLILGLVCAIAALSTGILFTATSQTEWEAIQTWRIEWLLAAVVAFLGGLLLKK